jgi:hypothetical protein
VNDWFKPLIFADVQNHLANQLLLNVKNAAPSANPLARTKKVAQSTSVPVHNKSVEKATPPLLLKKVLAQLLNVALPLLPPPPKNLPQLHQPLPQSLQLPLTQPPQPPTVPIVSIQNLKNNTLSVRNGNSVATNTLADSLSTNVKLQLKNLNVDAELNRAVKANF